MYIVSKGERWVQENLINFTYDELRCKCGGPTCPGLPIHQVELREFLLTAQDMRSMLGFPWQINSGYRCGAYNDSLYGSKGTHTNGPHTKGALDIGVSFERAYLIMQEAFMRNMGVGPVQHGDVSSRFIHIDNQGPRCWTY